MSTTRVLALCFYSAGRVFSLTALVASADAWTATETNHAPEDGPPADGWLQWAEGSGTEGRGEFVRNQELTVVPGKLSAVIALGWRSNLFSL